MQGIEKQIEESEIQVAHDKLKESLNALLAAKAKEASTHREYIKATNESAAAKKLFEAAKKKHSDLLEKASAAK